MELVLSGGLDEVLVAADPSGLHGLGGQLLQFVGHLQATDHRIKKSGYIDLSSISNRNLY